VGTFTEEGTFAAAAERLPELARLGITAVELMPVADFPGRFGWGYDGVLPFAPHAPYGTPDELKHFVQEAHRLGLMVFLDVVYNHFGPDGNYLARYAPQFFSTSHASPWGAAINFDAEGSRTVRDFFIHNALYWVQEYRIDGLRLDAVHAIVDGSTPHILEQLSQAVRHATPGRQVHLVLEHEHNAYHWLAP
jgi:1,4-alpha-glucan branching enzyme/maltooligosyltrehalose trehalohydrolase